MRKLACLFLFACASASFAQVGPPPSTGGAPTINPAGGQQNYAPIASPAFTGTTTLGVANGAALILPNSATINALSTSGTGYSVFGVNSANQIIFGSGNGGSWGLLNFYAGGKSVIQASAATVALMSQTTAPSYVTNPVTVTASAAPALNAALGGQSITLSANATPTITGITTGVRVSFQICQPSSGGPYTWTWPSAIHGGSTIGTAAGTCTQQEFYSYTGSTLVALNAGVTGVAP